MRNEQTDKAPSRGRTSDPVIGSVHNALRLLEVFKDQPSISVKEGAARLGVAPSTAHRLLSTLLSHGFVSQDPANRSYRAGPALLDIALGALEGIDVRRTARHHLERLSAAVRETVNLIVLDGTMIRFLDSVEGPEAVRVSSRTGTVLPAHCTAGGKVLLAALGEAQLRRLYPTRRLVGLTAHSVTDRSRLEAELERVRRDGFAASFEQSTAGLSAIAVPIEDPRGNTIAAIGVSAPSARLDDGRVAAIAKAAAESAARIARELLVPVRG